VTDDCRCIHRAGAIDMPPTNVAPRMDTPDSAEERTRIATFLGAALMKPLHISAQQHRMNVEQSLNTMTRAERVYLEIEMTERAKVSHSFEYDPLR
jgi:hypothetical protein